MIPTACAASSASRNLVRDVERFLERDRAFVDAVGERRPLDELEHERGGVAAVFETVDVRDVGMV